eukprot:m.242911 g.242911  ORF g.242911 m.242911 type:complete len:63 (-) comp17139_c0_seq4:541-729(-)
MPAGGRQEPLPTACKHSRARRTPVRTVVAPVLRSRSNKETKAETPQVEGGNEEEDDEDDDNG